MNKSFLNVVAVTLALFFSKFSSATTDENTLVNQLLDTVHAASKNADINAYLSSFSDDAIVMGTDAEERWDKAQLKTYVEPIFEAGGWEFILQKREISVHNAKQVAWFDELLHSASFGKMRASGVAVNEEGIWKIAQYHLTIPIPNAIAGDVITLIENRDAPRKQ